MKIVIADINLIPHRERFEAAMPAGAVVQWHPDGVPLDDLRDADVHIGSRFTAEMASAAEKLRLIHIAGAGTDKVDFDSVPPDVLVANTFHHERSIAEYIVAAAVMLRRDFLDQDRKLRLCEFLHDARAVRVKGRAGFGETHVACGPIQKPRADRLFELCDLFADEGL